MSEANVQKIVAKIKEDSSKKIASVKEKGIVEADEVIKKAEEEAKSITERILAKGKREAEMEEQRIIANAKHSSRKEILEAKEEILKSAFSQAEKELLKFSSSPEYKGVLLKLIQSTVESVGGGNVEVLVRKEDQAVIDNKALADIARNVKDADTKITLSKDTTRTIGGVFVRSTDGKYSANNTFENRMERMRSELRAKVAGIIFG